LHRGDVDDDDAIVVAPSQIASVICQPQNPVRDASELSERDRATLAGLLIESLDAEPEPDVEAAWSAEIERRVADIDSGNVKAIPWEDVRRRLLDRLNAL
jgi:putative addiction module component (TIGR02574 family)